MADDPDEPWTPQFPRELMYRGIPVVFDETAPVNQIGIQNITRSTYPWWRAANDAGQAQRLSRDIIERFIAVQQRYIEPRTHNVNWESIEALYDRMVRKELIHPLLRVSEGL